MRASLKAMGVATIFRVANAGERQTQNPGYSVVA
jgi:hypothetical protein